MACYLTAPSHYLKQCCPLISDILWHSPESNFTVSTPATIPYNEFENHTFKNIVTSGERVKQYNKYITQPYIYIYIFQNVGFTACVVVYYTHTGTYCQTFNISHTLLGNNIVHHSAVVENHLSALLQLHLHSRLDTCLQHNAQRQLQDENRNLSFGI